MNTMIIERMLQLWMEHMKIKFLIISIIVFLACCKSNDLTDSFLENANSLRIEKVYTEKLDSNLLPMKIGDETLWVTNFSLITELEIKRIQSIDDGEIIEFIFNSEGQNGLAEITSSQGMLCLIINNEIISLNEISEPLTDGRISTSKKYLLNILPFKD